MSAGATRLPCGVREEEEEEGEHWCRKPMRGGAAERRNARA